jgi:hypothetical protein
MFVQKVLTAMALAAFVTANPLSAPQKRQVGCTEGLCTLGGEDGVCELVCDPYAFELEWCRLQNVLRTDTAHRRRQKVYTRRLCKCSATLISRATHRLDSVWQRFSCEYFSLCVDPELTSSVPSVCLLRKFSALLAESLANHVVFLGFSQA